MNKNPLQIKIFSTTMPAVNFPVSAIESLEADANTWLRDNKDQITDERVLVRQEACGSNEAYLNVTVYVEYFLITDSEDANITGLP